MKLENLVNSAETRREVYFDYFHDECIFSGMSLKVQEKSGVPLQLGDFDSIIEDHLAKRGINYLSEFQPLPRSQIAILGETYHFVHKFAIRNHDYRNPVPLLKQTLEALEPIDDEYAAKLLYDICGLTTKDSKKRYSDIPRIVNFFENILPKLFEEYKNGLKEIDRDRSNEDTYKRKKDSVVSYYKKSLDIGFELTLDSVKRKVEFGFDKLERVRRERRIVQDFKTVYILQNS